MEGYRIVHALTKVHLAVISGGKALPNICILHLTMIPTEIRRPKTTCEDHTLKVPTKSSNCDGFVDPITGATTPF